MSKHVIRMDLTNVGVSIYHMYWSTTAGFPKVGAVASPGVSQINLTIFGIHQHHFSTFNQLRSSMLSKRPDLHCT